MINKTKNILQVVLLSTSPLLAMEPEEVPRTLKPIEHPVLDRVRNSHKYGVIPSKYVPRYLIDDIAELKDQEQLPPTVTNENTEQKNKPFRSPPILQLPSFS